MVSLRSIVYSSFMTGNQRESAARTGKPRSVRTIAPQRITTTTGNSCDTLIVNHLFSDDYVAAPLTFLAAVAARTSRVRLGTAVVLAPLHNAVEIAEQAAMVDLISGGRLDLGLGTGYRVPEYELFGADLRRRYAQTDAKAKEVRRLLSPVTSHPVQAEVPIWMGYQGPKGARRAGPARGRTAVGGRAQLASVPRRAAGRRT